MEHIAAFEEEPDAVATAIALREQGHECQVVTKSDKSYDERMRDFFSGKPHPYETHALLIAEGAEDAAFAREVRLHYGQIVR
jgi:hypothetical protein